MGYTRSPLRYPGGKSRLVPFFRSLIVRNDLVGGTYVEPFAGGAGIACALLLEGTVSRVILNDIDPAVLAFWRAVFWHTDELCELIFKTPRTMRSWKAQRRIIQEPAQHSTLSLGFAAFFLNRTNRSGVIRGGVIGGKGQEGEWHLDARYNADDLTRRIYAIAEFRSHVKIRGMDALAFIRKSAGTFPAKTIVFIDPPYITRGKDLYMNTLHPADHVRLARVIKSLLRRPWVVSYDDDPLPRQLYRAFPSRVFHLCYSAAARYVGEETLFLSKNLKVPRGKLPRR